MRYVRSVGLDIPEEERRLLKAAAALAGKSLDSYLFDILDESINDNVAWLKERLGAVKRSQPVPIREHDVGVTEEEAARGLSALFG